MMKYVGIENAGEALRMQNKQTKKKSGLYCIKTGNGIYVKTYFKISIMSSHKHFHHVPAGWMVNLWRQHLRPAFYAE